MSEYNFEKIAIIGLGYIGLPTAAMFAARKKQVVGIDINASTVDIINSGKIHIVEPELDMVVHAAVKEGFLRATLDYEAADVFFIAVPTPFIKGTYQPDLSHIESACNSIAPVLREGNIVILESTSPVGTTEKISKWLADKRPDLTFPHSHHETSHIRIAHCPERVLPGHIMHELVENDRIIGGLTDKCSKAAAALYETFIRGKCHITNARTAEMTKLTENSFRDTNIAFANELSILCDKLEINVWKLIELANLHPRVNILKPGPGVGGHCIAVDPWFIVSSNKEDAQLIKKSRDVNDRKPDWVIEQIKEKIEKTKKVNSKPVIACYGLTFKADIDDLRESPARYIIERLEKSNLSKLLIIEPNIEKLPASLKHSTLATTEEALKIADIHVLLVDHKEFKLISPPNHNQIIDTRGIWIKTI